MLTQRGPIIWFPLLRFFQLAICDQSQSSSPVQSMFPTVPSSSAAIPSPGASTVATTATSTTSAICTTEAHSRGNQLMNHALGNIVHDELNSSSSSSAPRQQNLPDASQQQKPHMLDPAFLSAFLPNASGVGAAMHPGLAFNFASHGYSAKEEGGCGSSSNGQASGTNIPRDLSKGEETWQRYMVR